MHRIDTTTKSVDLYGSGKHGFQDAQAPGTPSTRLDAAAFNAYQEELARPVEAVGMTLEKGAGDQLVRALRFSHMVDTVVSPAIVATSSSEDLHCLFDLSTSGLMAGGTNGELLSFGQSGTQNAVHTVGSSYTGTIMDGAWPGGTYHGVFVGTGEEIQTRNGASSSAWTRRVNGSDTLRSVAFNSTPVVVAVGDNSTIYESTSDPTTFTDRSGNSAYSGDIYRVVHNGTVFCAGGAGGIQTSADGITWTGRLVAVVRWIEVVGTSMVAMTTGGYYVSTDNGVTWTANGGSIVNTQAAGEKVLYTDAGLIALSAIGSDPFYNASVFYSATLAKGNSVYSTGLYSQYQWNASAYVNNSSSPSGQAPNGMWICGDSGALGYHPFPFGRGY